MPLFSIIIPIYNAADYLDACLDSLSAQVAWDFEAICVDDGSTDSSPAMLKNRAREDGRLRVISQANRGPSAARNAGLRAASGDFIVFLDSDDALEPQALARLAETFGTSGADAVVFGWNCFGGKPDRWMKDHATVRDAFYPEFEPALLFRESTQPFLRVAARRRLIESHAISFDEALYLGEDAAFLFALYPHANGVRLLPDKLYRYRLPHGGSIMQGVSGNAVEECVQSVNATISITGNWASNGLLDRFGHDLVEWTVKTSVYSALRRDQPVRNELTGLIRELWLSFWSERELRAMEIPRHAKRLVLRVLQQDASSPARDLLAYRLAEYGPVDLARTIPEKLFRRS